MSRKISIRLPDEMYSALDKTAGESSLSALVVGLIREIMQGERPLLQSDTAAEFREYCEKTVSSADAALRYLLSRVEDGY
jgi:hypothetical protein